MLLFSPLFQYVQKCIRSNSIPVLVLTTYDELTKSLQCGSKLFSSAKLFLSHICGKDRTLISLTTSSVPLNKQPSQTDTQMSNIDIFSMSPLHHIGNTAVVGVGFYKIIRQAVFNFDLVLVVQFGGTIWLYNWYAYRSS